MGLGRGLVVDEFRLGSPSRLPGVLALNKGRDEERGAVAKGVPVLARALCPSGPWTRPLRAWFSKIRCRGLNGKGEAKKLTEELHERGEAGRTSLENPTRSLNLWFSRRQTNSISPDISSTKVRAVSSGNPRN